MISEELTDKQREALIATRIHGMPMEEVARRMGTNHNGLYQLLHDARQRLKTRLEEEGQSSDVVRNLLVQIARTQQRELDCGELFAVLDQYSEAIVAGEDVTDQFSLVVQHFELCADCLEEYEALLTVLQTKH